MIARLLCLLGWHRHTYRERRSLYGFDVLYLVCDTCEHAEPIITRHADEYQRFATRQTPAPIAKRVIPPSASERARAVESVRPFRRAK